ncbi:MAG TPA: phosphate ABC transporter permease PstA [Terricaulis sp.]|nr:phosphate ABC transporter permease PstA [Terricaulis sp.]
MATVETNPRADITAQPTGLALRRFKDKSFIIWGVLATLIGLGTLAALVGDLVVDGAHRLSPEFFMTFPSSDAAHAGILSAWVGSILVIITTAAFAIPVGVLAGVYLEEYAPKNPLTSAIEIAVNNLAGVPSIIYGLLAVGLFVQLLGMGQSILTAGVTLGLLILPVVIVATREAVRGVPQDIRNAALAVGATKWQATSHHVIPYALPGVVTGVIIGISRAIGETAPLILIGGLTFVAFLPVTLPGDHKFEVIGAVDQYGAPMTPEATELVRIHHDGVVVMPDFSEVAVEAGQEIELPHGATVQTVADLGDAVASWSPTNWLGSDFTVLPIQMFNWTSRPQAAFLENAAAAGLVLLFITLLLNGAAIWLRYRLRKRIKW